MAAELNWSGNYAYRGTIARPATVDEVQQLVVQASADRPLRALGTRHTFNDIADSVTLVATGEMPGRVEVDEARRVALVSPGLRYGDVALTLEERGWALANLASLPHISIGGAIATATHGSGVHNRNLSSAVAGLTFVAGSGDLVTLRRGDEGFDGAVVALGRLGIVVEVELDLEPTYRVTQRVFPGLPYEAITAVLGAGYSVSVFTDWSPGQPNNVWVKSRLPQDADPTELVVGLGAQPAEVPLHPIQEVDPSATTTQLGVPGPWYERLPHFRLGFTPSVGEEIQSEYLVPRAQAAAAIEAVRAIGPELAPVLAISELRTIAADSLWLSTAYSTGSDDWAEGALAIHLTLVRDQAGAERAAALMEDTLGQFGARPHWGKVFADPGRLPALYPRFADFQALVAQYDPRGVFRNSYTDRLGL